MIVDAYAIRYLVTGEYLLYIPAINEMVPCAINSDLPVVRYRLELEDSDTYELIKQNLKGYYNENELTHLKRVPSLAFCILTNKCNMSCEFCYAQKNTDDYEGSFQVEYIEKLKEKLPQESFQHTNFSGGEPLLEFELMKKLRPYFEGATVYTNGSLLTDEIVTWAINTGTKFYISLDYKIDGVCGHDADKTRELLDTFTVKYPKLKDLLELSIVYPVDQVENLTENRSQQCEFEKGLSHTFNFIDGETPQVQSIIDELKRVESNEISPIESIFMRHLKYIESAVQNNGFNTLSCDPSITINYRGDILACHEYASSHSCCYDKFNFGTYDTFNLEDYFVQVKNMRYRGLCPENHCSIRYMCGNVCWANININRYSCQYNDVAFPYALYLYVNYSGRPVEEFIKLCNFGHAKVGEDNGIKILQTQAFIPK